MFSTCNHANHMTMMIQIRHVPEDVHRKLKARAALEGLSLSDFLRREIEALAERPSISELQARLAQREPVRVRGSVAKAVRAERDAR